jgi:hypothetical protein
MASWAQEVETIVSIFVALLAEICGNRVIVWDSPSPCWKIMLRSVRDAPSFRPHKKKEPTYVAREIYKKILKNIFQKGRFFTRTEEQHLADNNVYNYGSLQS